MERKTFYIIWTKRPNEEWHLHAIRSDKYQADLLAEHIDDQHDMIAKVKRSHATLPTD